MSQLHINGENTFPLIIEEVEYAYEDSDRKAVNSISLTIEQGSFVAVLGHNGSGKSTLAKLMNALYLPTGGKVIVCGMDTKNEDAWKIHEKAGMVFQNPDNQLVANLVEDDVAFGLENTGVAQEEMPGRIKEALTAVGMLEKAEFAPHMLSGGQKQRVAIAGVLAMHPEIMIMDEVTAMLDPSGRADVLHTVQKLNREEGITVVWITHFMEEAAAAERVIVLNDGEIAFDNTPRKVFSHVEELRQLGLDVPPMAEMSAKLRKAGMPLIEDILTVEDMTKELKKALCRFK